MGRLTHEHRQLPYVRDTDEPPRHAATRVDKSQRRSIDAGAGCGSGTTCVVRSFSFLKSRGQRNSEPELFAGRGKGPGGQGCLVCAPHGVGASAFVYAQQHVTNT